MIFNIPVGGAKTVVVTLHGGSNEVIQYTGKASGSVTLDANGKKTGIELKAGAYTFTGKTSGYSKTVTIKNDATVKVHPEGAIFWYGNGDGSGDTLASKFGAFKFDTEKRPNVGNIGKGPTTATVTANAQSYQLYYRWSGTGTGYVICANAYMDKEIATTGYSKLHVAGSMTGGGSWNTTDTLTKGFTPKSSAGSTPATLTAGKYLVFNQTGYVDPYGKMSNTITINAIWLE